MQRRNETVVLEDVVKYTNGPTCLLETSCC